MLRLKARLIRAFFRSIKTEVYVKNIKVLQLILNNRARKN